MTNMAKVNTDLVLATGAEENPDQRKLFAGAFEAIQDGDMGFSLGSIRNHFIFYGDEAFSVGPKGRIDDNLLGLDVAMDNRKIFFFHGAGLPELTQVESCVAF